MEDQETCTAECEFCGKEFTEEELMWIHNLHEWICWECFDKEEDLFFIG